MRRKHTSQLKALLSDVESDSDDLFIFRVSLLLESEIELLPPLSLCIHLGSITSIMQDTEPSTWPKAGQEAQRFLNVRQSSSPAEKLDEKKPKRVIFFQFWLIITTQTQNHGVSLWLLFIYSLGEVVWKYFSKSHRGKCWIKIKLMTAGDTMHHLACSWDFKRNVILPHYK